MFASRRLAVSAARTSPVRAAFARQQSTAAAITPAALSQIETRWAKLPECEQGAIADFLAEKQKGDWKKLTLEEKRAAYFIAYGPYGARSPHDPAMKWKVLLWSSTFVGVSLGMWFYWTKEVVPELRTHSPEWKAEEERRAIENKQNPYTGTYAQYRHAIDGKSH
ncbi:cytochrome c oxidase subunit IV-domain-containing protein [Fimicolochytrium jonesii]|uniref:cytochrome c oxidase subunit IV-domain-containing protein n=1 Tax=Fimicolochytrium jonesii TaxID=1396493 RepID=UPI0022FE82B6|nr:cytochrome c oxidase subunit IV-domain-containing protein [Fimicolochytrium jonesii]KAI8825955.1 cytochrome c oxidase subunit IV-domain-containing protein [Fimicolochytrium jonesii]